MTDHAQPNGEPADDITQPHPAISGPGAAPPGATTHDVPPPAAPVPSAPIAWGDPDLTAPVTTMPVTAVALRGGPRSRLRWGIALVVVALVAGTASAAWVLMSGGSQTSPLRAYAPAGSVVYAEIRGDLPGDQRAQLGAFLSHFPGFADQSNLELKLSETLDKLIRQGTNGRHDYSTEIKPWFGGQVALAIPKNPVDTSVFRTKGAGYLTITDAAKAKAYFDGIIGSTQTQETRDGVQVYVFDKGAYAVDGTVLVIGDAETVRSSLDAAHAANGVGRLADEAGFKAALSSAKGDWLVFGFVNPAGITAAQKAALPTTDMAMPDFKACAGPLNTLQSPTADWEAFNLRADGSSLRFQVAMPSPAGGSLPTAHSSRLAAHLPASTIAEYGVHDLGKTLLTVIDNCRKDPEIAKMLEQVDQAVSTFGGYEQLIGWIGDADLAITRDGGKIGGGLAVLATSKEDAARIAAQARNALALAASTAGITTTDEDYNGTTITLIRSSKPETEPDFPGIAFAVRDDLVAIGWGDAFVKQVLDAKPGASLADQARYKQAIGLVGAENIGQGFVDLTAVRELAESAAGDANLKEYTEEYKPYLAPFDLLAFSSTSDGGVMNGEMVITAK